MNVLVIGQGGREHALVRALQLSPSVTSVHAAPGSEGIARESATPSSGKPSVRCHPIPWENFDQLRSLIRRERIDLVVVGPEIPLAGGLANALRAEGIKVFGPNAEGARLEASKIFSKEFMVEAGARTARFHIVNSVEATRQAARDFAPPYVLKADGLAAGKGVFICKTQDELLAAAHSIFDERSLGDAGDRALLEEFQPGYEISYLILTDGESFEPLVLAQDHKRLLDDDRGPNTGGMGVVAPVEIDSALRERIDREIVAPVLKTMRKRGFLYRGVLYIGLMITSDGPSVLEFNVRFGDPEAQALLPLLDGDWGAVFAEIAEGRVPKLKWKKAASACVVLAAEGYPDHPVKGVAIEGDLSELAPGSDLTGYFLHAGTQAAGGAQAMGGALGTDSKATGFATGGGRVLNAVGLGATLADALTNAYRIASRVSWPGMQYRRDIGAKVQR
jgi:phosphoribosylamine--glycine ligase